MLKRVMLTTFAMIALTVMVNAASVDNTGTIKTFTTAWGGGYIAFWLSEYPNVQYQIADNHQYRKEIVAFLIMAKTNGDKVEVHINNGAGTNQRWVETVKVYTP